MAEANAPVMQGGSFYGAVQQRREQCDAIFTDLQHSSARKLPAHAHELLFFAVLLQGDYGERYGKILSSDPTDYEKRKILGYEERHRPSVPGVLDTKFHVDGSLEKCRAKIADLEKKIPRLKIVVEDYVHVKASFKPWPRHLINKLKTEELDRQLIAGGKLPQGSHRQNLRSSRSTEFVPGS
jgi:hypothetical protein